MKAMILLFFLILPITAYSDEKTVYCKLARNLMNNHIREVKNKNFVLIASGGGFFYDVENITLHFEIRKPVTLAEARILYVSAVSRLLSQINSNEPIQPYLRDKPFTIENLDYQLSFKKVWPNPENRYIAFVGTGHNQIYYYICNPTLGIRCYQKIYEESYDDAVGIVMQSEIQCGL